MLKIMLLRLPLLSFHNTKMNESEKHMHFPFHTINIPQSAMKNTSLCLSFGHFV